MLLRDDLEDYIREVVKNADSMVSLKMRANVEGVDNLEIAKIAEDAKVDYLHVDAMKKGVFDADFDLIRQLADETNLFIIGNNSVNSREQAQKMILGVILALVLIGCVVEAKKREKGIYPRLGF